MKKVFTRTPLTTLIIGCLSLASTFNSHAIELKSEPWTLTVNGNINGHFAYVQCETNGTKVAGNPLLCTGDNATSVSNGYLPTSIDFGISREIDGYNIGVHFAYEGGTVTNGPFNIGGSTESFRGFLTIEKQDFGEVKIGRDYGVFGIDVILADMSLIGFGAHAVAKSPLNTTLGSSGYGYIFVDRLSQINYSLPKQGAFSATIGLFQPLDPTTLGAENTFVGDSGSTAPGLHGKLRFDFDNGFISSTFLTQKIDNGLVSETAIAWDVTTKVNFDDLSIVASYHDGSGVGQSGLFFDAIDAQGKARNSDGYFVQAMYNLGKTRVGINYGQTNLAANSNDPNTNLKQSTKVTLGVYHSLVEGVTLVVEASQYQSENHVGQNIENMGLNVGAVYFF